ncbi:hypothetical protein BN946_scf184633.g6 [Trametes cinnabarina]|uniref:Uncharacterized protein n=1 Tax=Pycnoporus cinnabarinus TaxID=5643 RepID=A0A060SL52_PYCCI|nr:hypothetical protein BN946_scf184633.g6 [Trametes cinnabarina]
MNTEKAEHWRAKYKTGADLFDKVQLPQMPAVFNPERLKGMKELTSTELYLPFKDRLDCIVYWPMLPDQAQELAVRLLSKLDLDWDNPEHIFFTSLCLPDVPGSLLPKMVCSESDVASWSDCLILRPALAAYRACCSPSRPSLFGKDGILYISSSPTGAVIPDRLILQGVEYIEAKEASAWEQHEKAEWEKGENQGQLIVPLLVSGIVPAAAAVTFEIPDFVLIDGQVIHGGHGQ